MEMVASVSRYYGYCFAKIMKTDNNDNKEYCSITILDSTLTTPITVKAFSQQKPAQALRY